MAKSKINPAHPGRVLKQEFMEPLGLSNYALAKATGLSAMHIGNIVRGKRSISAEVALRLEAALRMSAQTWLNMQNTYDLLSAQNSYGKHIKRSVKCLLKENHHSPAAF